ncbi:MAG: hypothetical protein ACLFNN_01095 [Candidatus Paceibacterota bacterium]
MERSILRAKLWARLLLLKPVFIDGNRYFENLQAEMTIGGLLPEDVGMTKQQFEDLKERYTHHEEEFFYVCSSR